jgi:transglutaminase-like putative cysteine protease
MRLGVHYVTGYRYSSPANALIQLLRLTPLSCSSQSVLDWRIDVDCDARIREGRDGYGNVTHMLYVDQPVEALKISVTGRVLTEDRAGVVQGLPGDLPAGIFLRNTELTHPDAALHNMAAALLHQGGTSLERLHRLNHALYARLTFEPGSTGAGTSAAAAFAAGRGVCQDFVHIFLAVARSAGLPARYVSGHLFRRGGESRQSAAHAWAEAWVEDLGWVAFDPTNGICADDAYIRVATGLDYGEAAPVVGRRRGGGAEALTVDVTVREVGVRMGQSQSSGSQRQSQSQE